MRTQLLVAEHLRANGWPHATSAGSGRAGCDILETPDIAVVVLDNNEGDSCHE